MKYLFLALAFVARVQSAIVTSENDTSIAIHNDRLSFTIDKTNGILGHIHLDGQDLQGPQSNTSGRGYYECHCVPMGYQVAASDIFSIAANGNATFTLIKGVDGSLVPYAGVFMQQVLPIGHTFQQWYFIRDDPSATGLHNFARMLYSNSTVGPPFEDGGIPVREIREVFQFNTTLWQTASTNPILNVSIPDQGAITPAVPAQDATWDLATNAPDEPYVLQTSDWWTKYFIADAYRKRKAHGLYGKTETGMAYGAWMVSVTQDTLFGGPTHYDLLLDGMIGVPEGSANLVRIPHIYYYFASSHQGAATTNLTNEGYDRTWGPQYLYFNKGQQASLPTLRADAEAEADFSKYATFYQSIAHLVPGFIPPVARGAVSLSGMNLPPAAEDVVAVLSAEGLEFQRNVLDLKASQYWSDVSAQGTLQIADVAEGTYRLTVYASGIFGSFVKDGVVVRAGQTTALTGLTWEEESAGTEIWRIGTPDKSAGEFKHGFELDPNKTFHPMQYRSYWGAYSFVDDFPNGVNFVVGQSNVGTDWNYAQIATSGANVNFTILFDLPETPAANSTATFTIQLAAASGPTGNEDFSSAAFASFPLAASVNNLTDALEWIIPSNVSSSCLERSGISCFTVTNKWTFPGSWLVNGTNQLVLGLHSGSGTRVMYDALRLELV
ncbi:Galactose mutarotase-like protein [Mycena sanguinolenta]|uniref:rhamnogalacturonan endolyase n=1 Tax=Mycena sanguinolenta TaxID=230812 RepID=A0A8H6XX35_9AGAR|nr:Galactose mutarotase-like protein [Mycena sanguinolenta]